MIKIYGNFGCVISKINYSKIKRQYELKTGEKVDLFLCESYDTSKTSNNEQIDETTTIKLKFIALVKA